MKKCPPGVLCIENMTLAVSFAIFCGVSFLYYKTSHKHYKKHHKNHHDHHEQHHNNQHHTHIPFNQDVRIRQNLDYRDTLLNPYSPPTQDTQYPMSTRGGVMPINVPTNIGSIDTTYQQVGILTPIKSNREEETNKILPLMGRPVFTNRDKWQFYTMTKNNIKLPIINKGKSGTSEYGCDNIFTGDNVFVEGYNHAFRATIYDTDTARYLPNL